MWEKPISINIFKLIFKGSKGKIIKEKVEGRWEYKKSKLNFQANLK